MLIRNWQRMDNELSYNFVAVGVDVDGLHCEPGHHLYRARPVDIGRENVPGHGYNAEVWPVAMLYPGEGDLEGLC